MNIKEIQQALISQGYFSEEQVQQPAKLKAAKLNKADRKKDYYSLNRYLSNSAMGQMQTQKKLHNFLEREQEETKALRLGRAYHSAILEPQFFDTDYCIKPNARSKAGKAELEALEQEGKELLSQTEYEAIKDLKENTNFEILNNCLYEQSVFFELEGVPCKSKVDAIAKNKSYFVDLKFVRDASPYAFQYAFQKYNYDRQLAFYKLGLEANGLLKPNAKIYILAIEKIQPYDFALYEVSENTLLSAEAKIRKGLDFWKEYSKTDKSNLASYQVTKKL